MSPNEKIFKEWAIRALGAAQAGLLMIAGGQIYIMSNFGHPKVRDVADAAIKIGEDYTKKKLQQAKSEEIELGGHAIILDED